MNVNVIEHPLIEAHLTRLRDAATSPRGFRAIVQRLSTLVAYEATKDLEVFPTSVTTPLGTAPGKELRWRIGLIPILRAGLAMVDPILNLIPDAEVWHLGFYRDENTLQPVEYYDKLHEAEPVDLGIVVDPMLATGGSATAAVASIKKWGVPRVKMIAMLAAPEGIAALHSAFPDVQIYTCAIDERLNDKGYILPGLGDAGDRIFNTVRKRG